MNSIQEDVFRRATMTPAQLAKQITESKMEKQRKKNLKKEKDADKIVMDKRRGTVMTQNTNRTSLNDVLNRHQDPKVVE